MQWINIFHSLIIPFLGAFALTLGKLIADHKLLSFDESNNIALDLVLVAVGALGAFDYKGGSLAATIDAGIVDVFLGAILLYLRYRRKLLAKTSIRYPVVTPLRGAVQLILGATAIIWTVTAF